MATKELLQLLPINYEAPFAAGGVEPEAAGCNPGSDPTDNCPDGSGPYAECPAGSVPLATCSGGCNPRTVQD